MSVDVGEGPFVLPVAIGTHRYAAELTEEFVLQTTPALRQAVDQGAEPGENSLNTEGLWARTQRRFEHGEGQEWFDEDDSDRKRISSSANLNLWETGEVSISDGMARHYPGGKTAAAVMLLVNTSVYFSINHQLFMVSNARSQDADEANILNTQLAIPSSSSWWLPRNSSCSVSSVSSRLRLTATGTPDTVDGKSVAAADSVEEMWAWLGGVGGQEFTASCRVRSAAVSRQAFLYIEIIDDNSSSVFATYVTPEVTTQVGVDTQMTVNIPLSSFNAGCRLKVVPCVVGAAVGETHDFSAFQVKNGLDNTTINTALRSRVTGGATSKMGLGDTTNIAAITTDGNAVYFADSNNIYKTTSSIDDRFSIGGAQALAYANGRLLGALANQLFEVDAAGVQTIIATHAASTFVYRQIISAPNGVYVIGDYGSGSNSEIYLLTIDETTGDFNSPVWATTLPALEQARTMLFYGGLMVLGTNRGIRLAQISGGGTLVYGPLIEPNFSGTGLGVGTLTGQGENIWFSFPGYNGNGTGIGRVSLRTLLDPLVPPFAAEAQLTMPSGSTNAECIGLGITTYGEIIAMHPTLGLYVQDSGELHSYGYFYTGWLRFGTTEPKVLTSFSLRHRALKGSIEVDLVTEDFTETLIGTSDVPLSLGAEFPVNVEVGEAFQFKILMRHDEVSPWEGPTLLRWTAKALVAPERVDEFVIPLRLYQEVAGGPDEDTPITLDPKAEWLYLKGLEAGGTVVDLTMGNDTYKVRVDRVKMQPREWTDDKEFFEGICLVRMVTTEPVA